MGELDTLLGELGDSPNEQGATSELDSLVADLSQQEPEGPGRIRSMFGSFLRGGGNIFSSLVKAPDIAQRKRALYQADVMERAAAGMELERPDNIHDEFAWVTAQILQKEVQEAEASGDVERAAKARLRLNEEKDLAVQEIGTNIREEPFYKAGLAFDDFVRNTFETNPTYAQEFWSGKVPEGLGSMTGFAATAAIGRGQLQKAGLGPRASAAISAAAPGAAVAYVQGFEDALVNGADITVAIESAERNAPLGLTEGLPIANILDRIDKGSGGLVKRSMLNAIKSGTEEALQESFQTVMSNAIAQGLYDPERGLWKGSGEGAAVGFTTGGIMSFLGTMVFGRRAGRSSEPLLTSEDSRIQGSVDVGFMGPMLPAELEPIAQERKRLKEALEAVGNRETPEVTTSAVRNVPVEELQTLGPELHEDDVGIDIAATMSEQAELIKEKIQVTEGGITIGEAMQIPGVSVIQVDDLSYDRRVAEVTDNPFVNFSEAEIQYYTNVAATQKVIERQGKGLLDGWIKTFAPDLKIAYSTGAFDKYFAEQGYERTMFEGSSTAGQAMIAPGDLATIEINPYALVDEQGVLNEGAFVETLAHEFGHVLMDNVFMQQDATVQKALYNSWRDWLNKLSEPNADGRYLYLEEFINTRHAPFVAQTMKKGVEELKWLEIADPDFRAKFKPSIQKYQFGFTEWVADSMARAAGRAPGVSGSVKKYFARVHDVLKRFYSRYNEEFAGQRTYDDFLQFLAVDQQFAKVKAELSEGQKVESTYEKNLETVSNVLKGTGASTYNEDNFKGDLDKFNKVMEYGYTLIQVARANPHINGLQSYLKDIRKWWTMKMDWTARADERLKQWQRLGRKGEERLGKFLQDLTVVSFDNAQRYEEGDVEFMELAEKWEMGEKELAVYMQIDQDMQAVLRTMQEAMLKDIRYTFKDDAIGLRQAEDELYATWEELYNRNFFPLSRFGRYYVTVFAEKDQVIEEVEYKAGDIISFEAYESEKLQKRRVKEASKDARFTVSHGLLSDTQQQFSGLPPQFLRMLEQRLMLTDAQMDTLSPAERELALEQQGELKELLKDIAPGQSFVKHLKNRKNVPGFSADAVRAYADYFLHFSNHVARIQYKSDLLNDINEVRRTEKEISAQEQGGRKRTQIREFMEEHLNYMLLPGNELANLRALGFIWYLGFVPKSAVVNLTQVPLVTYPFLAARYGDARATGALTKAMKDASLYWKAPWKISQGQVDMLDELKRQGIIDESLATELAAVSEGSVVQRLSPTAFLKSPKAARFIRSAAGKAAWMFQQAEKMNRRVTALAAYDLAIKDGLEHDAAVEAASTAVDSTQYEYARFNRPTFMRNKRSVFFLFWQYKQHTLHFLFNDPGNVRFVMMLLMMAGMSGLPFAEDLFDLVDYLGKKYNKLFGREVAPINIRRDIREVVAELGANPDLMMHGASRYSFGLPWLGDMLGVPVANTDMSGSLSMGRMVPGVDSLFGREGDFEERFARGTQEAFGPVASVPIELMRAVADDNPNTLKRFERAYPAFVKNLSRAYRYATEEMETSGSGDPLAEFDIENTGHQMEIAAQALGFAPTRVNEAKLHYYMTKEIVEYYELRRQHLMHLFDYAQRVEDDKLEAQVTNAIDRFNQSVPQKEFSIRAADIVRSRKMREQKRGLAEQGLFVPKTKAGVQGFIDKAFPTKELGGGVLEEKKKQGELDYLLQELNGASNGLEDQLAP